MKKKLTIAAMAVLAVPFSVQAAEFTNGSFETGLASIGSFTTVSAGDSTSIAGWTVGSGSVDYIGSYWNAQDGSRSLDMSGNGVGSISQTFDTTANTIYNISFWLGGNPAGAPPVKSLTLTVGANSQVFTFDTTGAPALPGMNWVQKTYSFLANGATSTLTFTSDTNTAFGPALDNVSVSAAPEPATWAMLIFGFGLAGAALRRRRSGMPAVA